LTQELYLAVKQNYQDSDSPLAKGENLEIAI